MTTKIITVATPARVIDYTDPEVIGEPTIPVVEGTSNIGSKIVEVASLDLEVRLSGLGEDVKPRRPDFVYKPEVVHAYESLSIDISIYRDDSIYITDTLEYVKNTDRFVEDTVEANDVLASSLSGSRGYEVFSNSDVSTLDVGLIKIDAVSTSEVKTANMQSYFGGSYVIPGYAGTNYTL